MSAVGSEFSHLNFNFYLFFLRCPSGILQFSLYRTRVYIDMSQILLRNSKKSISSRKIIAGVVSQVILMMQVLCSQVHTPLQVLRKFLQATYAGLKHGRIPTFEFPVEPISRSARHLYPYIK